MLQITHTITLKEVARGAICRYYKHLNRTSGFDRLLLLLLQFTVSQKEKK